MKRFETIALRRSGPSYRSLIDEEISAVSPAPRLANGLGMAMALLKKMNVTKGIVVLTLAVLAIPIQGVHAGSITYIVSQDNPAGLILTIDHPNSTFNSNTFTLKPPLTSWAVTGTLADFNAGVFSAGLDTVTLTGMTVTQTVLPGPVFTVPAATAARRSQARTRNDPQPFGDAPVVYSRRPVPRRC